MSHEWYIIHAISPKKEEAWYVTNVEVDKDAALQCFEAFGWNVDVVIGRRLVPDTPEVTSKR